MTLAQCVSAAVAPALFAACVTRGPVTRIAGGQTLEGRPIAHEAYAAVLRASVLEARGDARGAVAERALDEDPESPEIVTRIANLLCAPKGVSKDAADEALGSFDDALGLDPTYAPAWLGLAECRERRGNLAGALEAAERAAYYDPGSPRATRVVARLLFAMQRPSEAFTWLDALVTLAPESLDAQRALFDAAKARGDWVRAGRARTALATLGAADRDARRAALDDALRHGDLPLARTLATGLGLGASALALRALDASAPRLALEQANLVLAADPSDADAWIAALAAADELGDAEAFGKAARVLDAEPLEPSPRALELFSRLVARHAGREAAAALESAQRNP